MLVSISYYPNNILVSVLAFTIGATLFHLLLLSLEYAKNKAASNSAVIVVFCSLSGLLICFTFGLFESFYYTNRDVKYWVLINNSAVPGFCMLIAAVS